MVPPRRCCGRIRLAIFAGRPWRINVFLRLHAPEVLTISVPIGQNTML